MQLENIKSKLNQLLEKDALYVYSIKIKKAFGQDVLEILIDGEQRMGTQLLERIHADILASFTDEEINPKYGIELSSVGIERPLDSIESLHKAVGRYIYIESSSYKGNGTLLAFDGDIMQIEINEKGRIRKIQVSQADARKRRIAVKF